MTDTNIIWKDLKYFLNQSYYSAFDEMKMFNIKINQYVVLTNMPQEKYIVWNNNSTPYHQMLLNQTTPCTPPCVSLQNSYAKHFEPIKIFNKCKDEWAAWAIITEQGNVITGGDAQSGGDSSSVQSQLVNVKMIFSTNLAFAALLDNGTVVAWGRENFGGKIPDKIQTQLVNVKMIFSTNSSFAALLDNGTVVAWGYENYLMRNVKMAFSTRYELIALLNDGTVVAWEGKWRKIPIEIRSKLIEVKQIIPGGTKFAALCKNGEIYTW